MSDVSTFTRTHATEWVCVDCHLSIAGYTSDETGRDMPTPFADFPDVEDVTNGSPLEECDNHGDLSEWADDAERLWDAHTECDHDSFSLHPCAGCGSSQAGDRYAVTVSYVGLEG